MPPATPAPANNVIPLHSVRVFRDSAAGVMLTSALTLVRGGLAVFPCWPGTKRPLGDLVPNGHLEATTEPWLIEYWWEKHPDANIGLVPGRCDPPLLVLDADVKAGKRGLETLAQMERDGLIPPEAPRVRTPSGGVHVYLRLPAGAKPVGNHSPFKDVDVRSAKGYVLAPPSVVDDPEYGGAYELISGDRS